MSQTPKEREDKKRAVIQAYKSLFSGKDSVLVLEDMRKRFFADYPTYTNGMPERQEAENAGMRRAWLHIQNRIKYDLNNLKLTAEDE